MSTLQATPPDRNSTRSRSGTAVVAGGVLIAIVVSTLFLSLTGAHRTATCSDNQRTLPCRVCVGSLLRLRTLFALPAHASAPARPPSARRDHRPRAPAATSATRPHTSFCASQSRANTLIATHPTAPAVASLRRTRVDQGGAPTRGPSSTKQVEHSCRGTNHHQAGALDRRDRASAGRSQSDESLSGKALLRVESG